jgi:uncharacterized protein
MELTGTVLNVVHFGCFVDIGMHDSGLVHVSRLADRFIRDPHEVVAVGDIVKVWVMEVDKERRRVSLTMVRPGSERPRRPARGEGGGSGQAEHSGGDQAQGAQQGDRPPRGGQGRQGGRPQGRPQNQQGGQANQQGGRPQGGRPQGGRPDQGRRPQPAGAGQQGGAPQGEGGGSGGRSRDDRRGGYSGPPSRRPQGGGQGRLPHEFKPKPKPLIPLSDAMKKGKEPMRTFGDLMQFFETKTDDKKPPKKPAPNRAEQDEKRGPVSSDSPLAETLAESAVPGAGNVSDSAPVAPPPAAEPVESPAPAHREPSPEPQIPSADEGPSETA